MINPFEDEKVLLFCKNCNDNELLSFNSSVVNFSDPLSTKAKCVKCGWKGLIYKGNGPWRHECLEAARDYINPELIKKLKIFLGEDGINYFRKLKVRYNDVAPVLALGEYANLVSSSLEQLKKGEMEESFIDEDLENSDVPHAVHFIEGMQVRNFIRSTGDWDEREKRNILDDWWVEMVEQAIKED